jgi:hypothetical protein
MSKQKRITLKPSVMGDEGMSAMYLNPAYAASRPAVAEGVQAQYASLEPAVTGNHNRHDYVFMQASGTSESETDASGFGFGQEAPPPLQPRNSLSFSGAASAPRPPGSGLPALPPPLPPSDSPELPRKMSPLRRFSAASTFARIFGRHTSVSSKATLGESLGRNDMMNHTSVNINSQTGRPPQGELAHKQADPSASSRPGSTGVSRMQIAFFVMAAAALLLALTALGLASRKTSSNDTSPQSSSSTDLDDPAQPKSTMETYMLQLQSLWEEDANYAADYAAVYSVARPKTKLNFDTLQAPAASLDFPQPIGVRIYKRGMPTTTRTIHWISDHYVLLTTTSGVAHIWDADADRQVSARTIISSSSYNRYFGGVAVAGDKSCFAYTYTNQVRNSYSGTVSSTFYLLLFRIWFSSSGPSISTQLISYSSTSIAFTGVSNAVALSSDGSLLVIGTATGSLCEWRKNAGFWPSQPSCQYRGSHDFVSVSISVDSQYYLAGDQRSSSSLDTRLRLGSAGGSSLWTVSESSIVYRNVYSVAFAVNSTVALACDGYNIYARSAETGRLLWTRGYDCEALQIMPSDDRHVLVYEDGAPLYILAVSDGSVAATIGVAGEPITIATTPHAFTGVAMSPDGIIYVAGDPCQVYVPLLGQKWF